MCISIFVLIQSMLYILDPFILQVLYVVCEIDHDAFWSTYFVILHIICCECWIVCCVVHAWSLYFVSDVNSGTLV